jgi:hypothetical protein
MWILSLIAVAALALVIAFNFPEIDYYSFGDAVVPVTPITIETDVVRLASVTVDGQDASTTTVLAVRPEQDLTFDMQLQFKQSAWRSVRATGFFVPPKDQADLPLPQLRRQIVCRSSLGSGQHIDSSRLCQLARKSDAESAWKGVIRGPARKGNYLLQFVVRARRSNENAEDSREHVVWNMPLRVE